tara:strand:- start:8118 stop:9368 length:1251 start_codon:yes stop_codon:yes gene_type:complete
MRKISWEIVFVGILLFVVAIYVTSNRQDESYDVHTSSTPNPPKPPHPPSVHIIDLKHLENAEELQKIAELKSLESLKSLEKLARLMPNEFKEEFLKEINSAISEFDIDSADLSIDVKDGVIVVNRKYDIKQGEWEAVSPGVYAYVKKFDASKLTKTTLSIPFGSITIVGSNDSEASLTVQASGQITSANEISSIISTRTNLDGDAAVFTLETDSGELDSNFDLQAILTIPKHMEIYSVTKAGHINSTNIQGDQIYKTLGGHISLVDLKGDVKATTEGGHIEVRNSSGDFIIESLGGHLKADQFKGELLMRTSGGNIEALKVTGPLNAETGGGNIEISLVNSFKDISANTGAGTILIELPSSANADLALKATTVEIGKDLKFRGNKTKNSVNGTIGTGGTEIHAKSNFGTIVVKKNG